MTLFEFCAAIVEGFACFAVVAIPAILFLAWMERRAKRDRLP